MRKHGDPHPALDNQGNLIATYFPQTKEVALLQDIVFYEPRPRPLCKPCNSYFLVYTKTDIRNCCAINAAGAAYREARDTGLPLSGDEAIARGMDHYWRATAGKECGHTGKMTLKGKCYACEQVKTSRVASPRQLALEKGEAWYMPVEGDLCRNRHRALRHVDNGKCKECEDNKRAARAARVENKQPVTPPIFKLCPDMIITRQDAILAGFKHYRNGEPCAAGHTGWRYVSTSNCMECRKM